METQVNRIEPQAGRFPQAVVWIAGVALTLFCGVGIAALMGWIPNSLGGAADKTVLAQAPASAVPALAPKAPRVAASHPAAVAQVAPARLAARASCAECGVIESVRQIEAKGSGSGLGAVGGGVLGGLLGNQIGAGRGQDVMTVVGVVGGAVAGNEVEKRVKSTTRYEVTVRMSDGSSRVIGQAGLPAWHTGDKVKIIDGAIQSNA
jgi:outer membrane lipoprotein SlyB